MYIGWHCRALTKYPAVGSSAICFAFEPLATQEDLGRESTIVMIPNVGNIDFYISTLLIDFTKSLLRKLQTLFDSVDRATYIITALDVHATADDIAKLKRKKTGTIALQRQRRMLDANC
jgi:hypothetical protein